MTEEEPTKPAYVGHDLIDCNLVLEGGAMRIQFTAGVLDFLMLKGVFCKRVIGVSAGALTSFYYATGHIGRTIYLNMRFCQDWRYLSLKSFVRTGNACGREFFFHEVPEHLVPFDYAEVDASPIEVVSVASDLETGEGDYHVYEDAARELDYLIASSSMPLVSQTVEIDGKKLLDGGTVDSVPINYSLLTGTKKHIVVLTHDRGFIRKPSPVQPLIAQRYRDYPYFVERAQYRHIDYNRVYRQVKRMHEAGEAFAIFPPEPVVVSSMETDPNKLLALYEQGYETAMRAWPALEAYLAR